MQLKDSAISIRLEFSSGRPPVTTLADVNDALAPFGSRLSPIGRLAGKEIVGKTDRELPWAESADILRANDKRVFETGKPSFIHKCDQA